MEFTSLELLDSILSGEEFSTDHLDYLLSMRVPEDLYLEYKHGNELNDRKKANETMRQYISGFANSAGGILIIGIDNEWNITGCQSPGGGDLCEWASRSLTPISPYLFPPPRIFKVSHSQGDVLICVTDRALGLVPIKEKEGLEFYFRFHDQILENKTLKVPDYLISDIVLGRRQKPQLVIAEKSIIINKNEYRHPNRHTVAHASLSIELIIENASLFWSEVTLIGIVGWSITSFQRISNPLLGLLDVQNINPDNIDISEFDAIINLRHESRKVSKLFDPFVQSEVGIGVFDIPIHYLEISKLISYTWNAAIYITTKNTQPVFYQLSLKADNRLLMAANKNERLIPDSPLMEIVPTYNKRPVVSMENIIEEHF